MIGQQREILNSLGIDVWIPRAAVCQNIPSSHIWCDQVDLGLPQPVVEQAETMLVQPEAVLEKPVDKFEAVPEQPKLTPPSHVELRGEVSRFELQLIALPACVILVEASQLTQLQQQLWQNIRLALQGHLHHLQWPFPLLNLQDSRGISSYIQGFLDAHALDKQLICLGSIDYLEITGLMQPSLQELLEQPSLKKELWNILKQYLNKEQ